MTCMDPRGTVGSIYKGEYYTLVHTTYESSGPYGFREEDFLCFSHDAPGVGPSWTPGARLAGFIAGFIKRTTLRRFIKNFPMTPPGRGPYAPQGHGWQDL